LAHFGAGRAGYPATKVLLDTDIGGDIDDAVCLAYLLREPRCRLLGISTVCGQSDLRAAIADAVCRAAGRVDVPIVAGADLPLQAIPLYPTASGAGALSRWAHGSFEAGDAPAFLYRHISENPGQVHLVAIGPMTNVAQLFMRYPDAAGMLAGLHVMNGYFGVRALPDPMWNWNSWADTTASRIVFAAEVAVHRAITVDVTETVTVDADVAADVLPADDPLCRAVLDFGGAWLSDTGQLTLHDALVGVNVFCPEVCTLRRGRVRVGAQDGQTAFTPDDAKGNVDITCDVDRAAFWRILRDTLGSGPHVPTPHA
jgi:purine nucleosidase